MKTKICAKCKIEKPIDNFYPRTNRINQFFSYCKLCQKVWIKENPEKRKKISLKYSQSHKKELQKYYEDNKEKILRRFKKYRINNKIKIKEHYQTHKKEHLEYLLKNKDKISKRQRKYIKTHKKQISEYRRNRRKTDIDFKIIGYLRTRVWESLRGNSKSEHTIKMLGCSIEFLKKYLESKFTEGMTWENYGTGWNGRGETEWHIDHIRPCASFDLSKPSEQFRCFHYTNLQPLWARENLIKYDRIVGD